MSQSDRLIDIVSYAPGLTAALHLGADDRYRIEVADAELGDTTITGFDCEADARTFLLFGDFDDTPSNTARSIAGLASLHWS